VRCRKEVGKGKSPVFSQKTKRTSPELLDGAGMNRPSHKKPPRSDRSRANGPCAQEQSAEKKGARAGGAPFEAFLPNIRHARGSAGTPAKNAEGGAKKAGAPNTASWSASQQPPPGATKKKEPHRRVLENGVGRDQGKGGGKGQGARKWGKGNPAQAPPWKVSHAAKAHGAITPNKGP